MISAVFPTESPIVRYDNKKRGRKHNGCDYGQGEQSADDIFCGFFKVKFHLQNPHFPQNYRQGLP